MNRQYKQYGHEHFTIIKPFVIARIIQKVTIKEIAKELDMKFDTLANMLYRNGIRAITIRHQHRQGREIT